MSGHGGLCLVTFDMWFVQPNLKQIYTWTNISYYSIYIENGRSGDNQITSDSWILHLVILGAWLEVVHVQDKSGGPGHGTKKHMAFCLLQNTRNIHHLYMWSPILVVTFHAALERSGTVAAVCCISWNFQSVVPWDVNWKIQKQEQQTLLKSNNSEVSSDAVFFLKLPSLYLSNSGSFVLI